LPAEGARGDGELDGQRLLKLEAGGDESRQELRRDIGFTAGVAPTGHDFGDETLVSFVARDRLPTAVIDVLVEDGDATWFDGPGDDLDQGIDVADERGNPATPGGVEARGDFNGLGKVRLEETDIAKFATLAFTSCEFEETRGAVDGENLAVGSDDFGQIEGGVTGTTADIDDARALGDAGEHPGIEDAGAPETVLETEAEQFFIGSSEDIFFLVAHIVREWTRRSVLRTGPGEPGSGASP